MICDSGDPFEKEDLNNSPLALTLKWDVSLEVTPPVNKAKLAGDGVLPPLLFRMQESLAYLSE